MERKGTATPLLFLSHPLAPPPKVVKELAGTNQMLEEAIEVVLNKRGVSFKK